MAGTVLFTAANSSLGIHAVEHLLSTYPEHTLICTVRDASGYDVNTNRLRETIGEFPNAKATIHALDLLSLRAVHAFADKISTDISSGKLPPLSAIVANAYYWNLVGDPEITQDAFDKTIQVSYVSQCALILRLIGSYGDQGRVVLLSSDSHWTGKNSMEKYPPAIPSNLDDLIKPQAYEDKAGRGFQRYATAKLAVVTWFHALNRYLQKDPSTAKISAVAINPGNLVDSRALSSNTPPYMQRMQRFVLKPLLPVLKAVVDPTLRNSSQAGVDVMEVAVNPKFAGKRSYYTLLKEDECAPESRDEEKQEALWKKTLEWAKITPENTALKSAF
ncbi:putative short-chain dehydrogenase [Sporormia fimetaria CBS 119925]|uniref:Short-chain dehydrogenase n=1 Tax=Sporormia fimetaria CBS 119925 TaxID=1340428 RepID=A0A6A6V349_9PLEO|nr:putative short-chain dehydrogenase [Sporormia fimetaria CBS 119925]